MKCWGFLENGQGLTKASKWAQAADQSVRLSLPLFGRWGKRATEGSWCPEKLSLGEVPDDDGD